MTPIEVVIMIIFGLPITSLCIMFVILARRMMHTEEERAKIRKASMQARRHEAARRKARGTPKRPGRYAIR